MSRTMRNAVGALMMTSALVAVVPTGAEALVSVSAGGGHSCAIKVDATKIGRASCRERVYGLV